MNIYDKDFDRYNQELIERYVDRLKNNDYMIDDDALRNFKPAYRKSWYPTWVGRNMYYPIRRRDALYYAKNDLKMSEIKKMELINFNIIDMKIEKMLIKHCSIMNGMFRNTEFLRICLYGSPGFYDGENEYQNLRNVVLNCRFVKCVFMNSYATHTDWINCKFISFFIASLSF